ncbi:Immunoglobulin A1 protease [Salix suchowensis]|nr:Immunoglobulin A1 protease [Salix suchowensis]
MSAIVCGKRSFFEELTVTSPPVSKRIRCSSSSPVRFSPPRSNTPASNPPSFNFGSSSSSSSTLSEQLAAIFPDMDKQLIEKVLEECGDDLDSAIRSLNDLRLGSAENFSAATDKSGVIDESNAPAQGVATTDAEAAPTEGRSASAHLSLDGAEWVELFVREMMSASNIDDARARASRALEVLEKSICARAGAEAVKSFHQEHMILKEQVQALIQENTILKRAVSIQHERQKEYEERNQELQQLKQLVSQYQDQLRTLEVNNYALTLHLKQAQQSSSIPGRFHPDVF